MFGKSLGFWFSQTGMRLLNFLSEMQQVTTQTFPKPLWPFMSLPNIPQTLFAAQTFPNIFLRIAEHSCTNRLHLQCVSRISVCGQVQQNKIMSNDMKGGFIAWGARGREFKSHRPDHLIRSEFTTHLTLLKSFQFFVVELRTINSPRRRIERGGNPGCVILPRSVSTHAMPIERHGCRMVVSGTDSNAA